MENNKDIRNAIRAAKLKQWQVADMYGLSEGNFSRILRKELSLKKKEEIFTAIEKAKKEFKKVN
ncbi:hypothetical protein [Priestia megaterium]|uniref:hypothetical protein n=1 Tax=Priestia megaterium TaxID=1404 RepID=UPI00207AA274|nr:hypothetical protein [Priestia megaterium]USL33989.1 hypothetical protein LIT34_14280 [Priestia megaterium]